MKVAESNATAHAATRTGGASGKGFRPGQSGNPGGRPKGFTELREAARTHTKTALETLVAILKTGSDSAKVAAATAILDRGWGKAPQAITGEDGQGPITITLVWGDSAE